MLPKGQMIKQLTLLSFQGQRNAWQCGQAMGWKIPTCATFALHLSQLIGLTGFMQDVHDCTHALFKRTLCMEC
jgi:hypothetical protein